MGNLPFEKIERKILTKKKVETSPKFGAYPDRRPAEELINYGIVNIDKPKGPTSHQVSAYVQQILKIGKSGHSGTLDPKVTGVLAIALGRATRVSQYLLKAGKEYVAIMHLHKEVKEDKIKKVCKEFVGKIKQLPPIKSAIKRQVRERKIYYLEILEIKEKDVLFRVGCQAGTYIRKLCLHPDTEIITKDGFIPINRFCTLPKAIYSMQNDKIIQKNPSAIQKLPSPKKLIKIATELGISFIATPDHELLVSKKDRYKMIEAQLIKKGDYLVKSLVIPDCNQEIVIADLLDDNYLIQQENIRNQCKKAFISKHGSIRAMYRELKLDRKAFLSKSNYAITIHHLKLAGIYEKVKRDIHTFKTQKGKIIKIKELNEDFFYLLGLIASDGNNTREKGSVRYTKIKFHNKNEKLIDQFLKTYKKLFPNIPISKKKIRPELFQLDTSNSFLATIAASLGIKSPQKDSDLLPILNSEPNLIRFFLKGYFEGDGSVYYKKKMNLTTPKTKICLHTISHNDATRLHKMLLKIQIPNRIFRRNVQHSGRKYIMYEVSVGNIAAERRFIKDIGTNHPKKLEKFKKILSLKYNSGVNNHYYVALHYKEVIRKNKSKLHKLGGNLHRVLSSNIPITKGFYTKASKITKLSPPDDFIIERVKSVQKIQGTNYVYDMTVPVSHNFLIETGFVSSNCHDIGKKLGTGAHMAELIRTKAGPFNEDTLCTLQDLTDAYHYFKEGNEKYILKIIQPPENAIEHLPKIWVLDTSVNSLCHGANLKLPGIAKLEEAIEPDQNVAILTLKGELIAVGKAQLTSKNMLKEKGIAVKTDTVFMEPGIYPTVEKK